MAQYDRPTVSARLGGFALFLVLTLACFIWFVWSGHSILISIISKNSVIYFDKGSIYLLGAGISLAALTFATWYEGLLMRDLTERISKIISRTALLGVALMFILPNMSHYLSDRHLVRQGYDICSDASYQWFLYRKIAYTESKQTCDALVLERETARTQRQL